MRLSGDRFPTSALRGGEHQLQVARTNEVSATGLTRRRLGQSALTYATSAAANAAAAGLYASAVGLQRSGDSLTGLVNIAGTLVLYVGLLAGLAAAILFIAAMEELRLRWPWIDPASRRAFSIFWTLSLLGLVALGLLGAMYAGSAVAFTFERAQFIVVAFQGVCAVAAAIFAVALASLPFMLSAGSSRRLAIVAVLLAGVGIAGEMAIGISNSALYSPTSSSLLMFGGFPLVNLNLPFGALVAFSAALLWLAYRQLPSALDNGLAQSSAMISGPGAA